MDPNILFVSSMLLMNFGSKYVINDISEQLDNMFQHPLSKTIILFAMCYVASRNILTSAIYTSAISVIVYSLKHPFKNNNHMIPKSIVEKRMK
jgi:hypothetical protein